MPAVPVARVGEMYAAVLDLAADDTFLHMLLQYAAVGKGTGDGCFLLSTLDGVAFLADLDDYVQRAGDLAPPLPEPS
jgi:hypothetical protein